LSGPVYAKDAACLLSLWYTGDGTIQAVQLLKASGFPSIDQACLQAALGRRFERLPEGHSRGRTFFPIHWVVHPEQGDVPRHPQIKLDPSIPQLPAGSAMQSTGSGSLDEACKEAVDKSAFVPAITGGEPVSGTTDVAILWRLPQP
jgi:outer membrane biosynthesis protein TonB